MTYKGHVSGGVIVLDEPVKIKDGTHVYITIKAKTVTDSIAVAGSWIDDRSAEEIIADIKKSRRSKK